MYDWENNSALKRRKTCLFLTESHLILIEVFFESIKDQSFQVNLLQSRSKTELLHFFTRISIKKSLNPISLSATKHRDYAHDES